MSETAARPDAIQSLGAGIPTLEAVSDGRETLRRLLGPLASLKLTCVLFALSVLLVFFGTLAQAEMGLWTAVGTYFRWFYVWIPFQLIVIFGQKFFYLPADLEVAGSFPFPGGLTLGILLLTNLLAAHVLRFRLTWRRGGVLLIHAGLIIMMLGELAAYAQVEGIMAIEEGESSNYVMHTRDYELAIVHAKGDHDEVVVIPAGILQQGGRITNELLPFDVVVDEYMVNATLTDARPGEPNRATAGIGLQVIATAAPEVSGVETNRDNEPAAYVTFMKKGGKESLGTYLLPLQRQPQQVSMDGQNYDVALRYRRSYRPYRLELIDFRFDRYLGTSKPKNFSSQVRIVDPLGENREVLIRMNEPLFYRGETFYQAGYNEQTERGTRLQVVENAGWWLPYLSCVIVSVGMLWHFGLYLFEFLRGLKPVPAAEEGLLRYLPAGVALAGVLYFVAAMAPGVPTGDFHLSDAGRLPVLANGRVQPLDSLARVHLLILNKRQTYTDADGKQQPAIRWLLDVMTSALNRNQERASVDIEAFSVRNEDVRKLLKLPERASGLYTYREIGAERKAMADELEKLFQSGKKEAEWTVYERELADLASELGPFEEYARYETPHRVFRVENDQVRSLLGLETRSNLRYSIGEFLPRMTALIREGLKARAVPEKDRDAYQNKLVELLGHVELYIELARMGDYQVVRLAPERLPQLLREAEHGPRLAPPTADNEEWQPFLTALLRWMQKAARQPKGEQPEPNPAIESIFTILTAYSDGQADRFNEAVDEYQAYLDQAYADQELPQEPFRTRFESFFNQAEPFFHAEVLYLAILVATLLIWVYQAVAGVNLQALHRSVFWLTAVVLVVHTAAIGGRMYIQNRPPVTNLYSSAIFIGWGAVVLGMVVEWIYRIGIGNAISGVLGFVTCFVAHHLATSGDTLEMMQAVLDTNFWLATHVVCITLGYSATFVAGFVAVFFILMGVFTPLLNREWFRSISQILYGIICFATLLSFVGTVLGGIWADQSWGRFWGWDPKENGALLIVIWNALILHARWCGWVKQRGVAVLALAGNMITAWSWFGTNQLGVGLHAYGFNKTLAAWLFGFWMTHLFLIGIGLLPTRLWRSFGQGPPERGKKRQPRGDDEPPPDELAAGAFKPAPGY